MNLIVANKLSRGESLSVEEARAFACLPISRMCSVIDSVNGVVKKYRYLVTFTLDPSKGPHALDEVEKYIIKQLGRKPLQIVEAHLAREGGSGNTHVHWHVALCTLKCLKVDRFNYYRKLFGGVDISKTKAQSLEEGINYISKECIPLRVV